MPSGRPIETAVPPNTVGRKKLQYLKNASTARLTTTANAVRRLRFAPSLRAMAFAQKNENSTDAYSTATGSTVRHGVSDRQFAR